MSNIALALVLTYLLLSLLVTTLNEFIATSLKMRSKDLVEAIKTLVDDREIRRLFYAGGLIRSTDLSLAHSDEKANPSYLDGKTFANGLLNALGHSGSSFNLEGLKASIDQLGGGLLKDSLKSVIAMSAADLAGVQTGIATWFDSSMDRVSGDYVRKMKLISLGLGLVMAAALNVDSFRIAFYVSQNPEVVKTYEELAKNVTEAAPGGQAKDCTQEPPAEKDKCLAGLLNQQRDFLAQLPIGWTGDTLSEGKDPVGWILMKIFGLLLTGLAVSVGAPFWFDILQNVMNFRGAGKKADEKKD